MCKNTDVICKRLNIHQNRMRAIHNEYIHDDNSKHTPSLSVSCLGSLCHVQRLFCFSFVFASWRQSCLAIYIFSNFWKRYKCRNLCINHSNMKKNSAYKIMKLIIIIILDYYPLVCWRALKSKIPPDLAELLSSLPHHSSPMNRLVW